MKYYHPIEAVSHTLDIEFDIDENEESDPEDETEDPEIIERQMTKFSVEEMQRIAAESQTLSFESLQQKHRKLNIRKSFTGNFITLY